MVPPTMSSLAATSISEFTDPPVYTASNVSKLDPGVDNVIVPEAGAVNFHHTDDPLGELA